MKLLRDKLLIKPIVENKTASGIEIPINDEKICRGVVVDLAKGIEEIKVGDTILHNLAYDEFQENRLIDIVDVYAIYEKGDS